MLEKYSLLKSASSFIGFSILEKSIPFILLPILTNYLTPDDYGIISLGVLLNGVLLPFISLGSNTALLRNYFKLSEDQIPTFIGNIIILTSLSTVLLILIASIFHTSIFKYSSIPWAWQNVILLYTYFQFIVSIYLTLKQAQNRLVQFGFFSICLTFANIGLTLLLIAHYKYDWSGRFLAQFLAFSSFGLLALILLRLRGYLNVDFNRNYITSILSFGIPLIPHTTSNFLIATSNRLFLTYMLGLAATGLYSVGFQIGLIVGVLIDSFNRAWTPFLFKQLDKNNSSINLRIVKYSYASVVVIFLLAVVVSWIIPFLLQYFINDTYFDSFIFVPYIAFAYATKGIYSMLSAIFTYTEKTYIMARITFLTLIANILLTYFLIGEFGVIGAAYAMLLTFAFQSLITIPVAVKSHSLPWLFWINK